MLAATTGMSRIGVSKEHRSKVLNHSEGGIAAHYGHYDFDREKKAALIKLEQVILGILYGEQGKVVQFPGYLERITRPPVEVGRCKADPSPSKGETGMPR